MSSDSDCGDPSVTSNALPPEGEEDSGDEFEIVGWTPPSESSEVPVKLEPSKRLQCVSDPGEAESMSVMSVANSAAWEKFRAALRCSICLGHICEMTSTCCGHIFCGSCIRAQIRVRRKCPLCQRRLRPTDVHPLYF